MSDTFCILPFTHLSTRPNGDITPCCRSRDTLGNIQKYQKGGLSGKPLEERSTKERQWV